MRFSILTAVALASLVAVLPAAAQERLRPIGSVSYEPEPAAIQKDVYNIRPEDRRIRSLRILAEDGSADVRSLRVLYVDGDVEQVRVRQSLNEGQKTALYQLDDPKPIKSIEISYIPKGAVTLSLLADSRREPPPPPPAQWSEIGCKSVGLLGDRDTIILDTRDLYQALRLRSANYDIEMSEMTVRYAGGGRDNYRIRQLIPSGGRIGPIELRGERRRIAELEFVYRARTIGPYKTKLCVDGLKYVPGYEDEDDDN